MRPLTAACPPSMPSARSPRTQRWSLWEPQPPRPSNAHKPHAYRPAGRRRRAPSATDRTMHGLRREQNRGQLGDPGPAGPARVQPKRGGNRGKRRQRAMDARGGSGEGGIRPSTGALESAAALARSDEKAPRSQAPDTIPRQFLEKDAMKSHYCCSHPSLPCVFEMHLSVVGPVVILCGDRRFRPATMTSHHATPQDTYHTMRFVLFVHRREQVGGTKNE